MAGHLIGQFSGKPVFAAFLAAIGGELDELDQALADLRDKRWIDTGEGVQLDGIGELVNQSRQVADAVTIPFFAFEGQPNAQGFEVGRFRDDWEGWLTSVNLGDPEYRMVLRAKIRKDTSPGTTEDTIASLRFIFDADRVVIRDCGNAKMAAAIGRRLNENELSVARALDLFVRAGGVGIVDASHFDADNYFGFYGQKDAKGFETGTFADSIEL
jgi:hypothetical protein